MVNSNQRGGAGCVDHFRRTMEIQEIGQAVGGHRGGVSLHSMAVDCVTIEIQNVHIVLGRGNGWAGEKHTSVMWPIKTPPSLELELSTNPASSMAYQDAYRVWRELVGNTSRMSLIWGSSSLASFGLRLKNGASNSPMLSTNEPLWEIYWIRRRQKRHTELPFIFVSEHQNSLENLSFGISLVTSLLCSNRVHNSSGSSAPGRRRPMPTMAIGSRVDILLFVKNKNGFLLRR